MLKSRKELRREIKSASYHLASSGRKFCSNFRAKTMELFAGWVTQSPV